MMLKTHVIYAEEWEILISRISAYKSGKKDHS